MITHAERNAIILRRTLSAASWLYAMFNGTLGLLAWNAGLHARLLVAHAGLLGLAGTLLWKPRRGAAAATLLAAAGSIFFVAHAIRLHNLQAALVDGAYVLLAAVLLYKSRRQA
jgi:hypothetical protein